MENNNTIKDKAISWYKSLTGSQRITYIEKHYKTYSLPYSEKQMVSLYKKEFK